MEKIDELAIKWSIAKQKEDAARDERVSIEQEIIALHPAREEGSETFATPHGVKITTTGKLSYKVDMQRLLELTAAWPVEAQPFKTEVKADESKLKVIRAEAPDAWAQLAPAITVTPAKTGIKVVFKE
jgi:hypothetical protein